MRAVPAVLIALILAVACRSQSAAPTPSPSETPSPSPVASPTKSPLPAGWTTVTRTAEGFSVAIPPTWRAIDLDPETLASAVKVITEQNPAFAQAYSVEQLQGLAQQGIKLVAFDFSRSSGGFLTNLNVIRQTMPVEVGLEFFAQTAAAQVEVQMKTSAVKVEPAKVGELDARRIRYELQLQRPTGEIKALFYQYIALKGKDAFILTFTTRVEDGDRYLPTFAQIAANFALLQ